MGEPRIIEIKLDRGTIVHRNADVEQERKVAMFDLLENNYFAPAGHEGPFRILLRIEEDRLVVDLHSEADEKLETVRIGLSRFRRPIRNYFAICESYFKAVRTSAPHGIETVDMARRSLHNEAAELLQHTLADKIDIDFNTARRLFTLLCVLQIK
jgi:uncharacterized protein (UPF0262 family)